jgi:hypothetical protein
MVPVHPPVVTIDLPRRDVGSKFADDLDRFTEVSSSGLGETGSLLLAGLALSRHELPSDRVRSGDERSDVVRAHSALREGCSRAVVHELVIRAQRLQCFQLRAEIRPFVGITVECPLPAVLADPALK